MSAIDWFKRVILGTGPDDGVLGGPEGPEGPGGPEGRGGSDYIDNIREPNVFGGTKQFYTEDDDYPYAENYTSASSKKSGRETGATKSQSRKMQSGNITPVTGRSNLNISLMTPKSFEDDEMHKAIQMLRDEGRTIILNLENCEEEQSFVSFAIGLAGGVNGHLDKVSESIYILVPKNVELSGDFDDFESQAVQMPRSKSV